MIKYSIINCLLCFLLFGCITEYHATGLNEIENILVVEGIITDDETTITLSRSVNLTDNAAGSNYVNHAKVSIECSDGSQVQAEPTVSNGRYLLKTGTLDLEQKYRLKIQIDEFEYESKDYLKPNITPEIDSIFWTKKDRGQPVMIYIATHSPDNHNDLFYRWAFKEDWEIHSDLFLDKYPFYCWSMANNRDLLTGSSVRTVFGRISDNLINLSPSDRRLSVLYRINVKQNAISKNAFDYFENIKKNAQQTGSIFAPTPSELRGNIVCITDPGIPVIGYVDVSTTTQKHRFISRRDNVYEAPPWACEEVPKDSLLKWYGLIPSSYVLFYEAEESEDPEEPPEITTYVPLRCVNCTLFGTEQKPEDWPDTY